jgi:hypothetical protein
MKFLQKLFNNANHIVVVIVLFVVLFLAYKTADAQEVDVGGTFLSEFNGGFGIAYSHRVTPSIDIGLALISEQSFYDTTLENNANFNVRFIRERPEDWWAVLPDELSLGGAYWIHTSRVIGCNVGFDLGLRWRLGDHWGFGWRHWSNAGTCKPNHGQDLAFISYRF